MTERTGRLLTVGLDYGTAFSKCVVRHVGGKGSKTAFLVPFPVGAGDEYLVPSWLYRRDGRFLSPIVRCPLKDVGRVHNLKMRLADMAAGGDSTRWIGGDDEAPDEATVGRLVVFYLANLLWHVRSWIRKKWPDQGTHPNDRIFVNMCMPVASLDSDRVEDLFTDCLRSAYALSDRPAEPDWDHVCRGEEDAMPAHPDLCHLMPEVTANVMSYRESQAGEPGLFLFVDVGAGTVDLSVFLYPDPRYFGPQINFTATGVEPLGSAQIELGASHFEPEIRLDDLVRIKEGKVVGPAVRKMAGKAALERAAAALRTKIISHVHRVLSSARHQHVPDEFRSMNVLAGGGGWMEMPYKMSVMAAFPTLAGPQPEPELRNLPVPHDVDWPGTTCTNYRRFAVAYGLATPWWGWPSQKLPSEMKPLCIEPRRQADIVPAGEPDG